MSARDHRFVYLLNVAHKRVQQWILATGDGGTAARHGVLMAVRDDDAGVLLGDLGRALDLSASSVSGLIDRMSQSGLVERVPDAQDGRASRLRLTAAGRDARKAAVRRARALNEQLRDGFTDAELEVVARWLCSLSEKFPRNDD
jgi:DNA-binding MarR family transcriptional regulator